jgi:hypothetical protein
MRKVIVLGASIAQRPAKAGHTWVFLQYMLGFRRLGWDLLLIDRLEQEMCVDVQGRHCSINESANLRYFLRVMREFGLERDFALLYDGGRECFGRSYQDVVECLKHCGAFVNVMGFIGDAQLLSYPERRVFLDIDPGFPQMWCDLGLADLFENHSDFVTIGENIGHPDCTIPECGRNWIPWRQPVVLEQWPAQHGSTPEPFTSIGSWRGPYAPIDYHGRLYGLRVHEFRKFVSLPALTKQRFEVALDIHSAETSDLTLLAANGWQLADPAIVAADLWIYRRYIQESKAEFMATKGIYVDTRSGWFSDRSICYLASGRPVLAQDTGLAEHYPIGEGLLTFSTLDEAAAGVEEINCHYKRHSKAARQIAEEYFDSDKVLQQLLSKLGVD